jgi:hypothetical protein
VISLPTAASTGAVALITALTSGVSLAAASADGMVSFVCGGGGSGRGEGERGEQVSVLW